MQHVVIKGRIYRVLDLPAADVRESRRRLYAAGGGRPISFAAQQAVRKEASQ